ncbi:trypsin-like serine peptidase, partial [Sphaerisporangium melleum]|uniref:trypsin-like serine peptidase n=1 Tax=Sphaerisporangium melleum TaxID=321316 RepID=UPI0035575B6E
PTKVKNVNLPKTIGKVFFTVGDKEYWCSASSVQAKYRNLVATAGHCVFDEGVQNGALDNWVFIPGYYQGKAPWGIYVGKAAYTHYDFAVYEDYDSDYAFVTVYNGIAYAGEKQVTKSTYDGWNGYKYAKDVEISATEYTKCKDANGGETGDCWAKADPASEKVVPYSTKLGPTADGKSKVELFTKEVTKEQFDAAGNGNHNFNQAKYKSFPKVDADVVTKEFYDSYTGPGYKKMVDGAYTIEHYFLEYKAIV